MMETIAHDPAFETIAPHVDAAYYLARNPDVVTAGADPAEHYWRMGWREGRDPNAWFQTDYYLRANPDIRAAGLNPLWHYLAQGQREGRQPRPAANAAWRDEIDRLPPPDERIAVWTAGPDATVLGPDALRALLDEACVAARGLVVAISHDRYTEVRGGTQFLVADEQRKFNGDNAAYLHLSPVEARLGLAPVSPAPLWLNVILDGNVRGIATAGAATVALDGAAESLPRILAVHTLHGHRPELVAGMARAFRPRHALFWVHDYGAACASPRLLRNDIAFCHAPPPRSLACRACGYGEDRPGHLARMEALFQAVAFRVVAPSAPALAQWRRAVALPARGFSVHPHARLEPLTAPVDPMADDGPARIAFVGQPDYHKGWGVFRDLVAAVRGLDCYQFYHFASTGELAALDGSTPVSAETSPAAPFGMANALAERRIDLVLALSPWPETFGYVAHEALAAGATLVALASAGNVADLTRGQAHAAVLADPAALIAYFTSLRAAGHVRDLRAAGRARADLIHCGSTATIALDGTADCLTTDPDLHLVAGGARLDGIQTADTWRFALPGLGGVRTVRLRSRHMRPAWESASDADSRRLGVAVTAVTLDGDPVAPRDPRRVTGWHPPESRWHWTDGDATLAVGRATVLEVSLVRLARYWRSPLLEPAAP